MKRTAVASSIRNSVAVESPYGLRSFALRVGDISTASDAVLAVPTHANKELAPTGAVLSRVVDQYGVDFVNVEPLIVPRTGFGTYRVAERGEFNGAEILLVRIPGRSSIENEGGDPLDVHRQALWTLFGSLAALELRAGELKSLALPLLAGSRGFEISDLMRAILDHSIAWLKASRLMHAVNLYLVDSEAIDQWSDAMDAVLGRSFVDAAQSQLVDALRAEILARLSSCPSVAFPASWSTSLVNLQRALSHQRIALESLATDGRVFAECVVVSLLKQQGVKQPKGTFDDRINELRRRKQIAPWIVSHFDCLRSFGNAGVHLGDDVSYRPPRLHDEDLLGILCSLQRVLEFVDKHDLTPPD